MLNSYLKILKDQGFKVTPRRKAIINIFISSKTHLTPEDVWQRLRENFEKCGMPSVYRNLETLAECGILTKIQQFDRKKHYGLCAFAGNDEHHHHIICVKCGKVEEIKECSFAQIQYLNGFKIVRHFMQVDGICDKCLI